MANETPLVPGAPARKPDAILVPWEYSRIGKPRTWANHEQFRQEFGPILGAARVYSQPRPVQKEYLVTATLADPYGLGIAYNYPKGHPREDETRFVWFDRGDGVHYGWLKPDNVTPTVLGTIKATQERMKAERDKWLQSDEGQAWLNELGVGHGPADVEPEEAT